MKTKGLGYIEAVQALVDGKCKGIRNLVWGTKRLHISLSSGLFRWRESDIAEDEIANVPVSTILNNNWELVEPKTTEERELTYWIIEWKNGSTPQIIKWASSLEPLRANPNIKEIIELKYKYTVDLE